ncbi:MAG: PilZ domain-containing protein [Planctomycetes bacterium]|nr:PilZ domain-containing protein [Planctomycetota bacterium]
MTDGANRRQFTRVELEGIDAALIASPSTVVTVISDEIEFSSNVVDVSMNGVFIRSGELIPAGSKCRVRLSNDSGLLIDAEGEVSRVDADGMAVQFTSLEVDDYQHLRRLVHYNAADADRVAGEIEDSSGIRPSR